MVPNPTATIALTDTALRIGETSQVTIAFSEGVTGFDNSDVTVDNGTLSTLVSSNGGKTWTANFTPTANIEDTTNVIRLANTYTNLAGKPGTPATSPNYTIDTKAPIATISLSDTDLRAGETSQVTIAFSEGVTGFGNSDVTVENGTLSTLASSDSGKTWSGIFTPTANLVDTTNVIRLATTYTDQAGNPGTTATSANYAIDTRATAPTVVNLAAIAAGTGGFVINGQAAGDFSGSSVSAVGDVNGDGLGDLFVGAVRTNSGAAKSYLVFGKATTGAVDLAAVAACSGGFIINGQEYMDGYVEPWASSAGDVNGDGLADLMVGSFKANGYTGKSYVVFGKTGTGAVDLNAIATGTGGFVINGQTAGDGSGLPVSSAGDVNGDGLADLLVGAHWASPSGRGASTGKSYVVYGKTGTGAVDLNSVAAGTGGFVIIGQAAGDCSGMSINSAGDVNGDGLGDLIIGAYNANGGAGKSYVVYGKTGTGVVDLNSVAAGTGGFVINGQAAGGGMSVSSAGDVNGDGLGDLIVGASSASPEGRTNAGKSYVVFGKTSTGAVDLNAVAAGMGGFVINGQAARDMSGKSVSSAGDINGDGLGDLIVGADWANGAAGKSYVVYGKTSTGAVDLNAVAAGSGGFAINGQDAGDQSGRSVSAAGDVNGDGLGDLIVGASEADPAGNTNAGKSYVIFGGQQFATTVDFMGTTGADTQTGTANAETFIGNAGNDTLIGNGGADVMYGGSGNDIFVLTSDNVARLAAGVTGGQLARIDGGSGIDTIKLAGGGVSLDLTTIANQAGGNPDGGSRLDSIERVDLTGSGNNTLRLAVKDVLDMGGMNSFNNANGWSDGTYNLAAGGANGANPERRHQLVVDGNAGDLVSTSGWTDVGTVTNNGHTYEVYNATNSSVMAQLLVDTMVTRAGIAA